MVSLFTGDQKDYWLTSLRLPTFIQVAIWKPRFQMSVTWISRSTWEMILGFISDPLTKSVRQKYRCPKKKRWCLRKKKREEGTRMSRDLYTPLPSPSASQLGLCWVPGAHVHEVSPLGHLGLVAPSLGSPHTAPRWHPGPQATAPPKAPSLTPGLPRAEKVLLGSGRQYAKNHPEQAQLHIPITWVTKW